MLSTTIIFKPCKFNVIYGHLEKVPKSFNQDWTWIRNIVKGQLETQQFYLSEPSFIPAAILNASRPLDILAIDEKVVGILLPPGQGGLPTHSMDVDKVCGSLPRWNINPSWRNLKWDTRVLYGAGWITRLWLKCNNSKYLGAV